MPTRILGGRGNRGRRSQKTSCRAPTLRRPSSRYERSRTRKANLCIIQVTEGHASDQLELFTDRIRELAGEFRAQQRAIRGRVRKVVVALGRLEATFFDERQIFRLLLHASREADAAKLKEMVLILPAGAFNGKSLVNRLKAEVHIKIKAVEQQIRGLGEALLAGETLVGVEPFAVLLPTYVSHDHMALKRLVDAYGVNHRSLFGVGSGDMQVEPRDVLGFVAVSETSDESTFQDARSVQRFVTEVEFQGPGDWRPVLGRLVFSPAIFDQLSVISTVSAETGEKELALALSNFVQGPLCYAIEVQVELPFRQLPRLADDALRSLEVPRKPVQEADTANGKGAREAQPGSWGLN